VVTPASIRGLLHRDDWKTILGILKKARRDAGSYQIEFRVCRPDGEVRWCLGTAAAIRDGANTISRISGVTMDITDRKEAEERQSLLAREVDHRAKNALAVVHSIVCLTRADNIKQYVAAVEGRIQALARAHSLLADSRWRGADIAQLIQEELAPYRAPNFDRIRILGRSISLEPRTAQALALAFHELATNAVKYGSLSSSAGGVEVGWHQNGSSLELRWVEHGGPPVEISAAGGFGIRVIKASVESQLDGTVALDWRREGLRCTISIPHSFQPFLDQTQALPQKPATHDVASVEVGPRRRILLVEDEILIAMAMVQTLDYLEFDVIGPLASVNDALAAVEREPLDAAILDINLGGEMVYPVAMALKARNVPFVFMTGYGSEAVTGPFPEARIFQKPIDREVLRQLFVANAPEMVAHRAAAFAH
jgi:two-component sensor histidine kinase/CheY-like chemotaxis protein